MSNVAVWYTRCVFILLLMFTNAHYHIYYIISMLCSSISSIFVSSQKLFENLLTISKWFEWRDIQSKCSIYFEGILCLSPLDFLDWIRYYSFDSIQFNSASPRALFSLFSIFGSFQYVVVGVCLLLFTSIRCMVN